MSDSLKTKSVNPISNTPYFIALQEEYFEQKVKLDNWHEEYELHDDLFNSNPYPQECLYRMVELLEIMDNVYAYAPNSGSGYLETKSSYLELCTENNPVKE